LLSATSTQIIDIIFLYARIFVYSMKIIYKNMNLPHYHSVSVSTHY